MAVIKAGLISVDIDKAATAALYEGQTALDRRCFCPCCRNYIENIGRLDVSVREFFAALGIEVEKCAEAWPFLPGGKRHTQLYRCLFPMVCTPLSDAELFSAENAETETVCRGLEIGIIKREGYYILADMEIRWTHS